jgi:hypothetical protein
MPRDPRDDRRAASRYATNRLPAFLGWYEDEAFRTTSAKLIDVSLLGIKVEVDDSPPREGMVWLCLSGQKPSQWIEVGVVESTSHRGLFRTRRQARLQFLESCPYDVFKGAIEDFSREVRHPAPTGKGPSSRDWC